MSLVLKVDVLVLDCPLEVVPSKLSEACGEAWHWLVPIEIISAFIKYSSVEGRWLVVKLSFSAHVWNCKKCRPAEND